MAVEYKYQVSVDFDEGRVGILSSVVLDDILRIATPPEFPKGVEGVWSPEHYFLAAVNGCLMTTFLAIAENFKLNFVDFSSDSEGTLGNVEGKFIMSKILLKPTIIIEKEEDRALAEKVILKADKACLISNSVNSEIELQPNIVVESN